MAGEGGAQRRANNGGSKWATRVARPPMQSSRNSESTATVGAAIRSAACSADSPALTRPPGSAHWSGWLRRPSARRVRINAAS